MPAVRPGPFARARKLPSGVSARQIVTPTRGTFTSKRPAARTRTPRCWREPGMLSRFHVVAGPLVWTHYRVVRSTQGHLHDPGLRANAPLPSRKPAFQANLGASSSPTRPALQLHETIARAARKLVIGARDS